jgi:hypothetical protein
LPGDIDHKFFAIIISSVGSSREGWSEAAEALATSSGEGLLDPPTPTRFDEGEWDW